ncbi:MAG: hypothetical protein QOC96_105 [Acidobacteriota bacterium]|jgi:hypothetical protein|nr:hypothetical protein [Acidobacteriota bacterium]
MKAFYIQRATEQVIRPERESRGFHLRDLNAQLSSTSIREASTRLMYNPTVPESERTATPERLIKGMDF